MVLDSELIPNQLKVTELKAECKSRGLSTSGKKNDLIQRLDEYLSSLSKEPQSIEPQSIEPQSIEPQSIETVENEKEDKINNSSLLIDQVLNKDKEDDLDIEIEKPQDIEMKEEIEKKDSMEIDTSISISTSEQSDIKGEIKEKVKVHPCLKIENLVRPYRVKDLEDLLNKFGTVQKFWINNIRSQCLVKFSNSEYSSSCYNEINQQVWPPMTGKNLNIEYLDPKEFEEVMNIKMKEEKNEDLPKSKDKENANSSELFEKATSTIKTLNQLFRKTNQLPSLYWLPLNEEEVINKQKIEESKPKRHSKSPRRSPPYNRRRSRSPPYRRPYRR